MAIPQKNQDTLFTYADYSSWPDNERWELIEGVPYDMSPAPSRLHQEISQLLELEISKFLDGKKCRMYHAPLDVRLSTSDAGDEEIDTVVQPDILVVCDKSKLDEKGCKGAPDLCVEILSPATAYKDQTEKFRLYESHGVSEYWIVHPELETVSVYILEDGEYNTPSLFKKRHTLKSSVLKGLELEIKSIFPEDK